VGVQSLGLECDPACEGCVRTIPGFGGIGLLSCSWGAVRVEAERAKLAPPLDAAGQVHAQRTWQRAERQLASAENVGQRAAIARQLIGSASPEELAVYAEEMPAEMSDNGVPTSWINDELAKAAPEYGKARQELEDAERKLLKIRHNHRLTSESYTKGRPPEARFMIDPT
jgi:hypothetical protein